MAGLVVACAVGVAGCSGGTSQPGPVSPAPPTALAGGYVYWANNASKSRSAAVQILGLRPIRGLRTPVRIGAMT